MKKRIESQVQFYSELFPATFTTAKGAQIYDKTGRMYIDFFSGAGALNYGHNPDFLIEALVEYIKRDGIFHALDMDTEIRSQFLDKFLSIILEPKGLEYKIQFTGPGGTNAVEAALKLARKCKRRRNILAFTNSFHGLTGSALSVSAMSAYRDERYLNRCDVTFVPFDGYLGEDIDSLPYIQHLLEDAGSGLDLPCAVILETVQAEGGVNAASFRWLRGLEQLCVEHDLLLIVDDIQVGVGRCGTFFSFEEAGIRPDIVILSKSIGGVGLPLSINLFRPELDEWFRGEHTGTFRSNSLALVGAHASLNFWRDDSLVTAIGQRSELLKQMLEALVTQYTNVLVRVKGRGLIFGLEFARRDCCRGVQREAFGHGLIVETCGASGNIIKILPPLTIDTVTLELGVERLRAALSACF
jgi:diaminobutyrate-2-oxoglutarate transaminase